MQRLSAAHSSYNYQERQLPVVQCVLKTMTEVSTLTDINEGVLTQTFGMFERICSKQLSLENLPEVIQGQS